MPPALPVLDPTQLRRIEAVHRGFLYQHLYAAGCLMLAAGAAALAVIVEADEDIEIVLPDRRLYVQVKTRSEPLAQGDIGGAIERFAQLRQEHIAGKRPGAAAFAVVANVEPGPRLAERLKGAVWPKDTSLYWPGNDPADRAIPAAWRDVGEGLVACAALAAALPFGSLVPETLVWKLAGQVMSAASGTSPRADHAFRADELPDLFEQLAIQLQDFPAPPLRYRSQDGEPELTSDALVRAITGFSGAGKTMWVAQAAQLGSAALAYFDVGDTPGPAIAIPLARELAGRFFGKSGGALGQLLLPGATGTEMLRAIGVRLRAENIDTTIVIRQRAPSSSRISACARAADAARAFHLSGPARSDGARSRWGAGRPTPSPRRWRIRAAAPTTRLVSACGISQPACRYMCRTPCRSPRPTMGASSRAFATSWKPGRTTPPRCRKSSWRGSSEA
jgi:hypothetical protein